VAQHHQRSVAVGGRQDDSHARGDQHLLAADLKRPAQRFDKPIQDW
jgi:hypothetical protein